LPDDKWRKIVGMKVMRIVVPSASEYTIRQLGKVAGVAFDAKEVVDVPLRTPEQIEAARTLEIKFKHNGLSTELRNGPNAVIVQTLEVVDLP
jgi:hypothetical protein